MTSERAALEDAAMSVEAMTWDRTFPNEPTPTTRDLVVFAATAGHIKRRLRALAATPEPRDGTETNCPLKGVHGHAFRGPHRFREWEPGT